LSSYFSAFFATVHCRNDLNVGSTLISSRYSASQFLVVAWIQRVENRDWYADRPRSMPSPADNLQILQIEEQLLAALDLQKNLWDVGHGGCRL
jgi:hypothetical protein